MKCKIAEERLKWGKDRETETEMGERNIHIDVEKKVDKKGEREEGIQDKVMQEQR